MNKSSSAKKKIFIASLYIQPKVLEKGSWPSKRGRHFQSLKSLSKKSKRSSSLLIVQSKKGEDGEKILKNKNY